MYVSLRKISSMESNTTHTDIASEPMMARPMTSYSEVMSYLHSIRITPEVKESIGRRLVVEATGPNLANAFARLDHLSELKNDWDGYGAEKISYYVLENLREVLLISDDVDWEKWMISPAPNGTLTLQSKQNMSAISIGDKEFSFYSCTDKGEEGNSHQPFKPSAVLNIMRRIV